MENINIETAQNIDIQYEIAGIGDRILAGLIDTLVVVAYVFAIAIVSDLVEMNVGYAVSMIAFFLVPMLYYLLCEILMNGQTIGKRAMSIKVARIDGTQPTLSNYLLRWLLRIVDVSFMFIGVIVMLFTEKVQRIGDLAAGTVVIKLKNRVTLNDTIYVELRENYTPTFPQVEKLNDSDMEVIKDVLKALHKTANSIAIFNMADHAKSVIERKMEIDHVAMPPRQFLDMVISDYNYYRGIL